MTKTKSQKLRAKQARQAALVKNTRFPRYPLRPKTKKNKVAKAAKSIIKSKAGTAKKPNSLVSTIANGGRLLASLAGPLTGSVIEKGIDFLEGLATSSLNTNSDGTIGAVGDILMVKEISPRALSNTRLQKISELYQRYIFDEVVIDYVPSINVTQSGQLIGYFDTDPADEPPPGLDGINYANSHGGVLFQISTPCSFRMPIIRDRTYYTNYTDPFSDERFKIQAVFRVLAVTTLPSGSALGSFNMKYACSLELPQMDVTGAPSASSTYGGYSSALTTTSLTAANRLSFVLDSSGTIQDSGRNPLYCNGTAGQTSGIVFYDDSIKYGFSDGFYDIVCYCTVGSGSYTFTDSGVADFFTNVGGAIITGSVHKATTTNVMAIVNVSASIIGANVNYPPTFNPSMALTSCSVTGVYCTIYYYANSSRSSSKHRTNFLAEKFNSLESQIVSLNKRLSGMSMQNMNVRDDWEIEVEVDPKIVPPKKRK